MTATDDRTDDALASGRMTIWEHLAELRTRLVRCAIAVALGMGIGYFVYPYLFDFLARPYAELCDCVPKFIAFEPIEPFTTRLKISTYFGIVLAMPVLLWQVWRFVTPGLYPHEKRYAVPFVASALVLFALGAAIAYWTLTPALQFLQGQAPQEVVNQYTVGAYVSLISLMMLAFGIGFEFPVLLVALEFVGVLTPRKLLSWWRYAIVIITVVAAVITPSGDPISMLALAVPMVVFYFLSIAIGAIFQRRRNRAVRGDDVIT
jgi:sec-independent protein translocase protein TatC